MTSPFDKLALRWGIRIEHLPETPSTNDRAREGDFGHGDAVVADAQSAGRGQRGNRWFSDPGANLTFSLVLTPAFLPAASGFLLSEVVSLALCEALGQYCIEAMIKWPNDIYVGGRKIAGILIENDIKGSMLSRSIVGIGLNVNQSSFDAALPNPVAMTLVTGRKHNTAEVFGVFYDIFRKKYDALEKCLREDLPVGAQGFAQNLEADVQGFASTACIEADYHRRLYRAGMPTRFVTPGGEPFTGVIERVESSGEIVVSRPGGPTRRYLFKELEMAEPWPGPITPPEPPIPER